MKRRGGVIHQEELALFPPAPAQIEWWKKGALTPEEMRRAIDEINPPKLPEDEDIPF